MIPPYTICRWLGHKRQSYIYGQRFDQRGRLRNKWGSRCTRCGTSDYGEVYKRGYLECVRYWRPRIIWWRAKEHLKNWWRQDCEDCGKPTVRCGRPVGDHRNCDVIPF